MRAHTRLEPVEDHANGFTWSSCRANLIQRGSALYLRVRDARSPELRSFKGLKWYELDRKFRISGQWTLFSVPKKITMPTADGRTFSDVSLGFVTFRSERAEMVRTGSKVSDLGPMDPVLCSKENHYANC